MTYKEPLEVLEAVLEKAVAEVEAGQWVTVGGRHMLIPNSQYHPTHGWVNVKSGTVSDAPMGRTPQVGVYHGTKQSDGSPVDFKEGESTHHAIAEGGKISVYNSERGTKVAEHPASAAGNLPAPTGGAGKPRATGQVGTRPTQEPYGQSQQARELGLSPATQHFVSGTPTGANEPRVSPAPSGPGRFSTKPLGKAAPGTHEHYAGEFPSLRGQLARGEKIVDHYDSQEQAEQAKVRTQEGGYYTNLRIVPNTMRIRGVARNNWTLVGKETEAAPPSVAGLFR